MNNICSINQKWVREPSPDPLGTETGNAIKNENNVRKELFLPEREDEESHFE